jgi:hypothetical protein
VVVDVEIGKTSGVWRMEQFGAFREFDQNVSPLRTAAASFPLLIGDRFVESGDAAT